MHILHALEISRVDKSCFRMIESNFNSIQLFLSFLKLFITDLFSGLNSVVRGDLILYNYCVNFIVSKLKIGKIKLKKICTQPFVFNTTDKIVEGDTTTFLV